MHPIQNGFSDAPDVGGPGGGIGLLRADHVEDQEALSATWMLGSHGNAPQIRQGVATGVQNRVEPSISPLSMREHRHV